MKLNMNKIISRIAFLLFLFSAISCARELEQGGGYGSLSVDLEQDTSEDIVLKSLVDPAQDQIFTLDFIRTYKDGTSKSEGTCRHTDIPSEGFSLPVGRYVVKASCGENAEAAFGEPFYTGEAGVEILANAQSKVNITTYLSNVKVTVDFTDEIKAGFKEYNVTVRNSRGGTLVFSNDEDIDTIDAEGYFKAGDNETLTWTLELVNNKNVRYTATDTYTGVKAREHYNIKFALGEKGEDVGGLYLTIKVDNATETKDYFAGIDFGGNEGPSITVNQEFAALLAKEDVVIPFGVEESKVVTLAAAKGLKSVVISHSDSKLYAKGLPYMTELSGAKPAQIAALASAGVYTEAASYGELDPVRVDITSFMAYLDMDQSYKLDFYIYDVYSHMAHLPLDFTVVVDADADMVKVSPWARLAMLTGKWFMDDQPEGLTFMYKKVSASDWMTVDPAQVKYDFAAKTYTANIVGLDAQTEYVVKAVSAADTDTREMRFTTDIQHQLYNMNFDIWDYFEDKANNRGGKTYYPYLSTATDAEKVWDSANPGTASFGWLGVNPNTVYVEGAETATGSGKAVKMSSVYAYVKFAAGNIYTGRFGKVIGTEGASLDWGTPFTGRPVALRGYYKYSPAAINRVPEKIPENVDPDIKGKTDKCQIVVILADWGHRFPINTTTGDFVLYDTDPNIIGFAKIESDEVIDSWEKGKFCLPIEYRDTERIPTHAVVVCCSSYLGDYFIGAEGSVMWADEFSFEYDFTSLTPEEQAKTNLN